MAKKFPNWIKTKHPQVQEAQQVPNSLKNMKTTTPRHVKIKSLQSQWLRENLKLVREKKTLYIHRKKDMDDCKLIVGNNASKKTLEQHISSAEWKQTHSAHL